MDEETINGFFICALVICIMVLIFFVGRFEGYQKGQKDASIGIQHWGLVTNINGVASWQKD